MYICSACVVSQATTLTSSAPAASYNLTPLATYSCTSVLMALVVLHLVGSRSPTEGPKRWSWACFLSATPVSSAILALALAQALPLPFSTSRMQGPLTRRYGCSREVLDVLEHVEGVRLATKVKGWACFIKSGGVEALLVSLVDVAHPVVVAVSF